jgi:hypothetical protein
MPARLIIAYFLIAVLIAAVGVGIALIRRNQRRHRWMMRGHRDYSRKDTRSVQETD